METNAYMNNAAVRNLWLPLTISGERLVWLNQIIYRNLEEALLLRK